MDTQIPSSFDDVKWRKRMISVLQRAPLQPKRQITKEPACQSQMEDLKNQELECDRAQKFQPGAQRRRHGEAAQICRSARVFGQLAPIRLARPRGKRERHHEIKNPSQDYDDPIHPGNNPIPLNCLKNTAIAGRVVIKHFELGSIPAVVAQMGRPLEGESSRKKGGANGTRRLVNPPRPVEHSVYALVKTGENRVADK